MTIWDIVITACGAVHMPDTDKAVECVTTVTQCVLQHEPEDLMQKALDDCKFTITKGIK